MSKKNPTQKGFVIPMALHNQLTELKLLGFTIAMVVRDAIDEQLAIENRVNISLQKHTFSTYYLEGL